MQQRVYGVGSYLALLVPQDTSDLLGQSPVSILGETVTRAAPQLAQLAAVLAVEARQGNPSGAGFVYDVLGTLQSALVRLGGRADRAPGPLAALAPRQLRGVQELVESELQNGVTVAVMAKFCGLSLAYFSRVFRNTTGVAPHRFVMQRRAERARSLLLGTKLSLSEIAYRVGYADHSHFTREFRKALGVRPSSLRLMNGGGGKGAVRDSKIGSLRLSINGRAVRRSQEKTADKS
jgi:AraC family transcriptional regulator